MNALVPHSPNITPDAPAFGRSRMTADVLDAAVGHIQCRLLSIDGQREAADVAAVLDWVFESSHQLWERLRDDMMLTEEQRTGLFEAIAVARLGVEIHIFDADRDLLVSGLVALERLVGHFSRRPDERARLPADRMADLKSLTKIAKHAAGIIVERDKMSGRAQLRALTTLDYTDRSTRGAA